MMMNEPVGVGTVRAALPVVDDKLVALHRTLKRIAKARAHLDLQEAEALREAQRLQLWRQFGHTSLADYMVQELGYSSHRVAEDRLRLANALPELPRLSEALQNGEINFSQARELARVMTPETQQPWLDKAKDMNVRQVEQAVAGHHKGDLPEDPIDPRLVRKTLWLSVRPETEVLFREARKALEKERGEKLDDDAALEALCRGRLADGRATRDPDSVPRGTDAGSVPRGTDDGSVEVRPSNDASSVDEVRPSSDASSVDDVNASRGAAPYRVAVTVCTACKRGWQHGGGAVEEMSPAAIERAQCDAQWIGDLDSPEVERARQEISPATRRKVLHRDKERCQVPACSCHNNLDIHHVVHREHGGTNELSNLISLCELCRARHKPHYAAYPIMPRRGGPLVDDAVGLRGIIRVRSGRRVGCRRADIGLGRRAAVRSWRAPALSS